jgi:hypothetical protein
LKRWFSDHSVFYRVKSGKRFSNIVYVYDIWITGDDIPGIQ